MVPSTVLQKREREIKLKATKEEYLKNLQDLAAEKQAQKRRKQEEDEEQEEFEALARESAQENTEEFSEILNAS